MPSHHRAPAVAGRFYPADPTALRSQVQAFLGERVEPIDVKALMVPHAGYVFSGQVAAEAYRRVKPPRVAVILCPNHTGRGPKVSLWNEGSWGTPLGDVPIEQGLADRLRSVSRLVTPDEEAHLAEHAIEVHLPFLQVLNPDVAIVPLVLGHLHPDECVQLGESISKMLVDGELLIASTDMSHFLPAEAAKKQDELALRKVEARDPIGLYRTVADHDISMCGFIPTAVALAAANALGAQSVIRVSYAHSGQVTRDSMSVVGYASALVV